MRMRSLVLSLIFVLILGLSLCYAEGDFKPSAEKSFEDGLKDGYYIISSPEDLYMMASYQGAKYRLASDIDMEGRNWTPVDFFGELDGAGHTISNLKAEETSGDVRIAYDGNMKRYACEFSGMFGCLDNAYIHDINIINVYVESESEGQCIFSGLLSGWMADSLVENVNISGRADLHTSSKCFGVGGFTGYGKGDIKNSSVDSTLVCVDRDAEHRDEQFMGGAYSAGYINIDHCNIKIDGYDSDHGYVHNGGIVGMYIQYEKAPKGNISYNYVEGRIRFFEDNKDRRAYCAPYGGEMMSWNLAMDGNKSDFKRDEVFDYSQDLYPEE